MIFGRNIARIILDGTLLPIDRIAADTPCSPGNTNANSTTETPSTQPTPATPTS
jgi:hypothetical protein